MTNDVTDLPASPTLPMLVDDWTGATNGHLNTYVNGGTDAGADFHFTTPTGVARIQAGAPVTFVDMKDTKLPVIAGKKISVSAFITQRSDTAERFAFGVTDGTTGAVALHVATATAAQTARLWSARTCTIVHAPTATTNGQTDLSKGVAGNSIVQVSKDASFNTAKDKTIVVRMDLDCSTSTPTMTYFVNGVQMGSEVNLGFANKTDFYPIFGCAGGIFDIDHVRVDAAPLPNIPTSFDITASGMTGDKTSGYVLPLNNIAVGSHIVLGFTPVPAGTLDTHTWTVSGSSVTIDSNNLLTVAGAGDSTITVKSDENPVLVETVTVSVTLGTGGVTHSSKWGDNTVYNTPFETAEAKAMWCSKHVCNHTKAIIATAFDLKNANDSLRRYGYTRGWRTKALYHYGKYVNKPDMAGIPLTPMATPWYHEMGYVAGITIDSVLAGGIAP